VRSDELRGELSPLVDRLRRRGAAADPPLAEGGEAAEPSPPLA